jgi:hypothetical protein
VVEDGDGVAPPAYPSKPGKNAARRRNVKVPRSPTSSSKSRRHQCRVESSTTRWKQIKMLNARGMQSLAEGDALSCQKLLKRASGLLNAVPHQARDSQFASLRALTLNNSSCWHWKMGSAHRALKCLHRALELVPHSYSSLTHLNICAILSHMGRHDMALSHARQALRCAKGEGEDNAGDMTMAVAYYNLAAELEHMGQSSVSAAWYSRALECAQSLGVEREGGGGPWLKMFEDAVASGRQSSAKKPMRQRKARARSAPPARQIPSSSAPPKQPRPRPQIIGRGGVPSVGRMRPMSARPRQANDPTIKSELAPGKIRPPRPQSAAPKLGARPLVSGRAVQTDGDARLALGSATIPEEEDRVCHAKMMRRAQEAAACSIQAVGRGYIQRSAACRQASQGGAAAGGGGGEKGSGSLQDGKNDTVAAPGRDQEGSEQSSNASGDGDERGSGDDRSDPPPNGTSSLTGSPCRSGSADQEAAATKIQSLHRGRATRRRLHAKLMRQGFPDEDLPPSLNLEASAAAERTFTTRGMFPDREEAPATLMKHLVNREL